MKKGKWIAPITVGSLVVVCVVISGISSAMAFGPGGRCGKFCGDGPGALSCLDLTTDQKKQVAAIIEKYQPQIDQAMDDIRKMQEQAVAAGEKGQFNEEAVRAKFRESTPKFEEIFVLKAKIKSETQAVLTETQRRELDENRAKWIEKSKDRRKFCKAMRKAWLEMDEE